MTREEAIEVFTELNYAYKADEYGDYFYDHGDEVCRAASVAIAALREQVGSFQNGNDHNTVKDWPPYMDLLREQEERSRGCEFCAETLKRFDHVLAVADYCEDDIVYEPKFCPMCGRRLEEV